MSESDIFSYDECQSSGTYTEDEHIRNLLNEYDFEIQIMTKKELDKLESDKRKKIESIEKKISNKSPKKQFILKMKIAKTKRKYNIKKRNIIYSARVKVLKLFGINY